MTSQPHERRGVPTEAQIRAGHVVYSPGLLRWYDFLVLTLSNHCIWHCPTRRLLELYHTHISANHLEVGVGTGYFLDRCRFPTPAPRLVLADLNEHCLQAASRRVARYAPIRLQYDLFQPLPDGLAPFDSIGLNYVLHCLPGDLTTKAVVFDHLAAVLHPGGVLFGSTLLADGVRHSFLARRLLAHYNRVKIFDNGRDTRADLEAGLAARFQEVHIETIGSVACFVARRAG